MIPTFEQFVNENMLTMRTQKEQEQNVAEILNAKKTFYSKKWQSNDYYPIHKYEWIEEKNTWEEFVQKIEGGKETWISRGLVRSPQPEKFTDREWLEFPFIHASYILSFNEMKDNKHYNDL